MPVRSRCAACLRQGNRREEWEVDKDGAYALAKDAALNADAIFDAICDKITQLENERADGMGVISWAYSCINNLQNDLIKAGNL